MRSPLTATSALPSIPRNRVFAWVLYDWGLQPFNTVIITFVFTALYLTTDAFLPPDVAALSATDPAKERALAGLSSGLGVWVTIAGILVALLAPVLGRHADAAGRRKAWLAGSTVALVLTMLAMFFVQAAPRYFALGAGLIALGSVFAEVAGVNYNAMLVNVSTPKTVGRVSGLGWGLSYLGGIVALLLVVWADAVSWWGMDTANGLPFRLVAVGCGIWAAIFCWPLFVLVPEAVGHEKRHEGGVIGAYHGLWLDIKDLYHNERNTLWFLGAAAVFRDGLAAVFTFGAIIAAVSFGFSPHEVLIFGLAASLVAGISTILVGRLDDSLGPRPVILGSLAVLVASGTTVMILHTHGQLVFWIGGLLLCCVVGPAQAAARSFLARVSPPGRESEIFGLYATTGRAVSFLTPALWSLFIAITGATIWGTAGIVVVILIGLLLMLRVRDPSRSLVKPRSVPLEGAQP